MNGVQINTDGGSRGNPGPAACGFLVVKGGSILARESKYLGIKTNNFAEYSGVIQALSWLERNYKQLQITNVQFILDSELVVRQINKIYKVKDEQIKILYEQVVNIMKNIKCNFSFTSVKREENKEADKLVNEELDKHNT